MKEKLKIALIGNPNVGKSSLFNQLTGLKQKTGNYPGITIDIKKGFFEFNNTSFEIIDFPGTYSIYPNSVDEEIVYHVLINKNHPDHPDKVVVVVDPFNLKRSMLLYLQIKDLNFPVILVFNFVDQLKKKGFTIDFKEIEQTFENEIILSNARKNEGIEILKEKIDQALFISHTNKFEIPIEYKGTLKEIQQKHPDYTPYEIWVALAQSNVNMVPEELKETILPYSKEFKIVPKRLQVLETIRRFSFLEKQCASFYQAQKSVKRNTFTHKIDKILTHKYWGYLIFLAVLYIIFQSLFYISAFPMDLIEGFFADLSTKVKNIIPSGPLQSIIANGIIPGIGGIVVFIPLIVILFTLLIILEEIGYMSRVVFLMDKWLKPFGLSGKSVVPLISGVACAIPAILSARNIENRKERLLTILVTPFMTCSARLPVYSILIALVIPKGDLWLVNYQSLMMMFLYLLGFIMAILGAFITQHFIKNPYKSYLILDMPSYKVPILKNVVLGVWSKSLDFVLGAGKIILAISVIIWALGAFGPESRFNFPIENEQNKEIKLEDSYLGLIGKTIEPVIQPLGYDWKMGIGLISSFAAREVFVSTMATVYSIDNEEDDPDKLSDRMRNEINQNTMQPAYTLASGVSLMLFYAFALQCISTLAVTRKELKGWKWPLIQFIIMGSLAYISAFIAYQLLK